MSLSDDLESLKAAALATLKHRQESRRQDEKRDELALLRAAALKSAQHKAALASKLKVPPKIPSDVEVDEISASGSDFSLIEDSSTNTTNDAGKPDILADDAIPDLLEDFDIDEFNEDDLITEPEPRPPSPKRKQVTSSKPKPAISKKKSLEETRKDLKETISRLQQMKEEKKRKSSASTRSKVKVDPVNTSVQSNRNKQSAGTKGSVISTVTINRKTASRVAAPRSSSNKPSNPNSNPRSSHRDQRLAGKSRNLISDKSDTKVQESYKEKTYNGKTVTGSKLKHVERTNDELEKITREKLVKRLESKTPEDQPDKTVNTSLNNNSKNSTLVETKSVMSRLGAKLTEEECDKSMKSNRKRKAETAKDSLPTKKMPTVSKTDLISSNESDEDIKLDSEFVQNKHVSERLGGFTRSSSRVESHRIISVEEKLPHKDLTLKKLSDREQILYDVNDVSVETPVARKENIWMRSERTTNQTGSSTKSHTHERLNTRRKRNSSSPETIPGSSALTIRSARERTKRQTSKDQESTSAYRSGGILGRTEQEMYSRETSRRENNSRSKSTVKDSKPKSQSEIALDKRIEEIKERNAAIEARQREIEREKFLFG